MKRSYRKTVDYLFGLLPMYQRTGAVVGKLDLSKTEALLAGLGDPHHRLTVVHVGGTNGKGSVSHAVAGLCTAAGRRVGLYTSPHYVDFRERIRVDGAMVPEEFVVSFVAEHQSLVERVGASFFEFTVAMAFAYFAEVGVDLAVIEVGLGGRLDSTNVVTPVVAVITNVDLDHTEILGDTRAAIAREKAGIIKSGRPVVIGRFQEETWPVFRSVAEEREAPVYKAWRFPDARLEAIDWESASIQGPFARENVRTALAAYAVLRKHYTISSPVLSALTSLTRLSGYSGRYLRRMIGENGSGPLVIADAGHNPAAWEAIAPAVLAEAGPRRVRVVCGFVRGKDPYDFARPWPAETAFYVVDLDLPRNAPRAVTVARLSEGSWPVRDFASVAAAYEAAVDDATPDELIFVGGSSFVVGAYLEAVS